MLHEQAQTQQRQLIHSRRALAYENIRLANKQGVVFAPLQVQLGAATVPASPVHNRTRSPHPAIFAAINKSALLQVSFQTLAYTNHIGFKHQQL